MSAHHSYDKKRHEAAKKALADLYVAFGANRERAFNIEVRGKTLRVDKRFLASYRRALDDMERRALVKGKKAKRSVEDLEKAVSSVHDRIETAFTRSWATSKAFQSAVLRGVRPMLRSQPKLSARSYAPTTLSFLDDHFVEFFRQVKDLDLLRASFSGESQAVRNELAKVNAGILDFLVSERVCASTVLQSLMSRYVAQYRQNDSRVKAQVIRLDGPLRALLQSHMDSMYNGDRLAQWYKANDKQQGDDKFALATFRQSHPNRSVEDFILEKAQGTEDAGTVRALLRDGLVPSSTLLILINAHLISRNVMVASGMNEAEVDSMILSNVGADGVEKNDIINKLLVIQTLVKLTTRKSTEPGDAPSTTAAARSPPRGSTSPRGRASSTSRSPARSAASPGRRTTRR